MNNNTWEEFHQKTVRNVLYPTEWVVRTLVGGNYPNLKLDKKNYSGARILDLSCGDGRNLGMLSDLGFEVYATEISRGSVDQVKDYAQGQSLDVSFHVGRNGALPFQSNFSDYVLSCASFYYLDQKLTIRKSLEEVSRILKPGGLFIGNIPDSRNAVLKGSELLEDGSRRICSDPFSLRNGVRFAFIDSSEELIQLSSPNFGLIASGKQDDDFYGLRVSGYFFVAETN